MVDEKLIDTHRHEMTDTYAEHTHTHTNTQPYANKITDSYEAHTHSHKHTHTHTHTHTHKGQIPMKKLSAREVTKPQEARQTMRWRQGRCSRIRMPCIRAQHALVQCCNSL